MPMTMKMTMLMSNKKFTKCWMAALEGKFESEMNRHQGVFNKTIPVAPKKLDND
jgi:hypothetical protein